MTMFNHRKALTLVVSLCATLTSIGFASQPIQPPPTDTPSPTDEARPELGGPDRFGETLSKEETITRWRSRATEVDAFATSLREAANKLETGTARLEAFRIIEEAAKPLRGDWLDRLAGTGNRNGFRRGPNSGPNSSPNGVSETNIDLDQQSGKRDGPRGERDRILTDEERERFLTFAREKLPQIATRLEELRATDPKGADMVIARLAPRIRDAMAARDPQLITLRLDEIQVGVLVLDRVRQFRDAQGSQDPANILAARTSLREAIDQQFDAKLKLQQHEITTLTSRIEELRKELERRQSNRAAFIDSLIERVENGGQLPKEGRNGPGREGGPGRGGPGREGSSGREGSPGREGSSGREGKPHANPDQIPKP